MRTMMEFATVFIDAVRLVIRGMLVFLMYTTLLGIMAYSFGQGCASKLPIRPKTRAAEEAPEYRGYADKEAYDSRWDWVWASAHE